MARPTHRQAQRPRKLFGGGVAALLVAAFAGGYAVDARAAAPAAVTTSVPNLEPNADRLSDQTAISACVIRLDDSSVTGHGQPSIHVNSSHFCSGVASVARDANGDLRVQHNAGGAIGSCIAEEDETLSRRAIMAGCSGGGGLTVVRFYRMGKHVRIQDINSTTANVWMLWVADPVDITPTPTPTPTPRPKPTPTETPTQTPTG